MTEPFGSATTDPFASGHPATAVAHRVPAPDPGPRRRRRSRKPPPPRWRVPVLASALVVAFALLAVAVWLSRPQQSALDDFYDRPTPFPAAAAGTLVKTEQITGTKLRGAVYRVMYHSRSVRGADIAVTGSIVVPNLPAPIGGRPVVSIGHPTVGSADECAPSRQLTANVALANRFLAQGWVVATTDYEGLGTEGPHPYLVGESEGRSMVDIVRAARALPQAGAGTTFAVWGHSQGGHAVLFARKLAARWAPELRMVGAVAVAPVSSVTDFLSRATFAGPGITLMAVAGYAASYPALDADQVLTPDGLDHLDDVESLCLGDLGKSLGDLGVKDLRRADPATTEPWAAELKDNDSGTIRSNVAVLLVQGDDDPIVPIEETAGVFAQMCATAQPVTLSVIAGGDHTTAATATEDEVVAWLTDRFSLTPDVSNCPA